MLYLKLDSKYIPPKVAIKQYGVSRATLSQWARTGKIRSVRIGTGTTSGRRYHEIDLKRYIGLSEEIHEEKEERKRLVVLYARVSSQKQKEDGDLQRQIEYLKEKNPVYDRIITDVASGINFKRKGLLSLLDLVEKGDVEKVVVSFKDRLARFGLDLIKRTFKQNNTALHVVSSKTDISDQQELAEDLLAVCNFFVAKNNGKRAADLRRSRGGKRESSKNKKTFSSSENDED